MQTVIAVGWKGRQDRRTGGRVVLTTAIACVLGGLIVTNAVAALKAAPAGFDRGGPALVQVAATTPLRMAVAAPGAIVTSDTTIRYREDSETAIRLFTEVSGTGLADYLHITVTSGSGRGAGFVPAAVMYDGTLAEMPRTFADGVTDPNSFSRGEMRTYRISAVLADDNDARGLSAGATFRWGTADA